MATYAVGDVQGCFGTLMRLLRRLHVSSSDRVWLAGDLVNRGPNSLEVLRWVRAQGKRAVVVLGNHDIHLISRFYSIARAKARDTLDDVLQARDAEELVEWLARQPFLHRQAGWVMVHAGILPDWTLADAMARARALEKALQGPKRDQLLAGEHRLIDDLRVFTRIRCCHVDGSLCGYDGPLGGVPNGCTPWFVGRKSAARSPPIIFGHWSALGLYLTEKAVGLDTGCVWGRSLTAIRLEDRKIFSEPSEEFARGQKR